VLDLELGSFGARELEPPHSFANVPDGNGHLVVLVWLDIFEEDLRWENLNGLRSVAQVVGSCVVKYRFWVSLQYGILLGCVFPHLN
jgi:hypothetical protein